MNFNTNTRTLTNAIAFTKGLNQGTYYRFINAGIVRGSSTPIIITIHNTPPVISGAAT